MLRLRHLSRAGHVLFSIPIACKTDYRSVAAPAVLFQTLIVVIVGGVPPAIPLLDVVVLICGGIGLLRIHMDDASSLHKAIVSIRVWFLRVQTVVKMRPGTPRVIIGVQATKQLNI